MNKVKNWLIKKFGGVPSYTLAHKMDESRPIYGVHPISVEASISVRNDLYDKEYVMDMLSKEIARFIVSRDMFSYEETRGLETEGDIVRCKMRIMVCK